MTIHGVLMFAGQLAHAHRLASGRKACDCKGMHVPHTCGCENPLRSLPCCCPLPQEHGYTWCQQLGCISSWTTARADRTARASGDALFMSMTHALSNDGPDFVCASKLLVTSSAPSRISASAAKTWQEATQAPTTSDPVVMHARRVQVSAHITRSS